MKLLIVLIIILFSENIFSQNNLHSFGNIENKIVCSDALYNKFSSPLKLENKVYKSYSLVNLTFQPVVGSSFAFIFTIPPFLGLLNDVWNSESAISHTVWGILTISAYCLGAGTGVYLVANIENKKLAYWDTVEYAVFGAAIGALTAAVLASQYSTIPNAGAIFIAFSPVIGAMFYTSFVADWPTQNQDLSFNNKILSHKDLINRTNIFNIEVIRIKL